MKHARSPHPHPLTDCAPGSLGRPGGGGVGVRPLGRQRGVGLSPTPAVCGVDGGSALPWQPDRRLIDS